MLIQAIKKPLGYVRAYWAVPTFGLFALCLALLFTAVSPTNTAAQTIPTFSIVSVARDQSVQIRTANFPPNTDFRVRMGPMGTRAINGTVVTIVNSGSGGVVDFSFAVPANLAGSGQIAVRLENDFMGHYAYNWFYNNSTAVAPQPPVIGDGDTGGPGAPDPGPVVPPPPITTYPSMAISNVVRNQSVTARLYDLSPNTTCSTQMGAHGSLGFGVGVGAFATDAGGTQDKTFTIPAELANSYRIAIRFDCVNGTHAFNWFYNNTASVPVP